MSYESDNCGHDDDGGDVGGVVAGCGDDDVTVLMKTMKVVMLMMIEI